METVAFVSGICFAAALYEFGRLYEHRSCNYMIWWFDYVRVITPSILFLAGTGLKLFK